MNPIGPAIIVDAGEIIVAAFVFVAFLGAPSDTLVLDTAPVFAIVVVEAHITNLRKIATDADIVTTMGTVWATVFITAVLCAVTVGATLTTGLLVAVDEAHPRLALVVFEAGLTKTEIRWSA
jgi:hypothetical protein